MNKKTVYMLVLAIVALTAGILVQQGAQIPKVAEAAAKPIEFSFPDVTDRMQSISQWHGKVLVINFWATWCAPCLKEIPEFMKLQAEYQQRGLQFIGVAIDEKKPVSEYLQHTNVNYPVLIAGDAGIGLTQQLGNIISAVPFTVVINQLGQVVYRKPGELSAEELKEVLMPLMSVKQG